MGKGRGELTVVGKPMTYGPGGLVWHGAWSKGLVAQTAFQTVFRLPLHRWLAAAALCLQCIVLQ